MMIEYVLSDRQMREAKEMVAEMGTLVENATTQVKRRDLLERIGTINKVLDEAREVHTSRGTLAMDSTTAT